MVVETRPGSAALAALAAAHPTRYPYLLESVAHGTPRGRYDILFAFPRESLLLHADGRLTRDGELLAGGDFLAALDSAWQAERAPVSQASIPFRSGWFLFLGYELAAQIEPRLAALPRDPRLPVAMAVRIPAAIVRDHEARCLHLVAQADGAGHLAQMHADLAAAPAQTTEEPLPLADVKEEDAARFVEGVRRIQEYIRAGDVYQVNLSRAWEARLRAPPAPAALYRRLRLANPAPFAGLAQLPGGVSILSSSPERLVAVRAGRISTRPIAGTHPRAADPDADRALAARLLAHPKERAEHVMLIDLERNDLGRVCAKGTVRVTELMALESYRHVHHIVSEVQGELGGGVTPGRVLRAVFPGGTITGCPKLRCMQIIAELESGPRGAYTGSVGYLDRSGDLDLNILIRSLVLDGARVVLRAGAGIVADSVAERELAETRAKARGLLAALGVA